MEEICEDASHACEMGCDSMGGDILLWPCQGQVYHVYCGCCSLIVISFCMKIFYRPIIEPLNQTFVFFITFLQLYD